jgi:HD-GYP domain-containing protein (c-di-GMP phosphodiesterase class II)
MRLTESVMAGGRVMLAGGRELTPEDIATLKRRFPKLHVRVGDPVLDELVDFQDDSHDREVAYTVQQRVGEALAGVQEKFSPRTSLAAVNFSSVQMAVGEVLQYLKCNSVSALLLSRSVESDCYLAEHAGNVFYASMLLGAIIREYVAAERKRQSLVRDLRDDHVMDMTPLGLGAMFADIGMLPLKHLFALDDPLSDEDREAVIRHPLDGAAMLGEDFSPLGRMIVRTHHENCAGKGYPNAVTRDKLHIFTRIVRIADAFDAATTQHVYREAKSVARVIWEMTVGPYRRFYDPYVMKVFASLVQPFPIGARLRMADGRYGVVIRYNQKQPFEPYVVIAFDGQGHRLPEDQLAGPFRVNERYEWRITKFGDEDLDYLYDSHPSDEDAPELNTVFATMYP